MINLKVFLILNCLGILYLNNRRAQHKFRLNRNDSDKMTAISIQEKRKIKSKKFSSKNKNDSMNKTIFTVTLLFLVVTLPTAYASFFFADMIKTNVGYFLIVLFNCVTFSYHGLYFFLLIFSNNKFKREFMNLVNFKQESTFERNGEVNQTIFEFSVKQVDLNKIKILNNDA